MTILAVLIPAVVAAGLAVLAAVVHRTGGLWLVQRPATPRQAETRQALSWQSPGTLGAPEAGQRRAIEVPRPPLHVIRSERPARAEEEP